MNQRTVPISVNTKVVNKVAKGADMVTLQTGFSSLNLTIDDISKHILEGHALCPAHLARDRDGNSIRKNGAFEQAQLVFLDIDNSIEAPDGSKRQKTDAEGYLAFDRIVQDEWCQTNLFIAYTTPSHTDAWHRFRMVFCLPESIISATHYGEIVRAFVDRFNADPACKSIVHIYYGNTNARIETFGKVLSNDFVVGTIERKAHLSREMKVIEPRVNENITTDVAREILAAIPAKLDYIDWVKVVSGVASHFEPDTAEQLINEWSPGKPGEVQYKIRNKLQQVNFGTVVYIARNHGWDDPNGLIKRKRGPKAPAIPDDAYARTFYRLTDAGNRERLEDALRGEAVYDRTANKWMIWTGKRYEEDTLSVVTSKAIARLRDIEGEIENVTDEAVAEAIRKHARKSESRAAIDNALNLATRGSSLVRVATDFDQDPMLLNLNNCVFDLRTFEITHHDPRHMMTRIINVDFDAEAECPKWEAFLAQIFEGDVEMIEFLQRSVGYTLSGLTDEQYFWFCYGTGANGKSVFFNVLQELFCDYYHKSPVEMLLQARSGGSEKNSNDLAAIAGKRLVVTDEFPNGRKLDSERIKNITGGDVISARYLFQEYFQFRANCKLWIYGNHYPNQTDRDEGFWRRVFIVPFAVTIPEAQRRPMSVLMDEFRAEMSGILRWAIDGFYKYKHEEDRLAIPEKVLKARESLKIQTDTLGPFLDEFIIDVDSTTALPASEVYKVYCEWAKESNEHLYSKKKLTQMLQERGWRTTRDRTRAMLFVGKALSATAASSQGLF